MANAYGVASVSGVLGAMREYGVCDKDSSEPSRWTLTDDGFLWSQLYCRECLKRSPNHKKSCRQPPAIVVPGADPEAAGEGGEADELGAGSALAELLAGGPLEIKVDLGELGESFVSVLEESSVVKLDAFYGDHELDAEAAVALGEALVAAGRRAKRQAV